MLGALEAASHQLSAIQFSPIRRRRPSRQHALAPYFLDWLAHPNYDDYWKQLSIEEHFADITVPMLHDRGLVRHFSRRIAAGTTSGSRRTAEAKRRGAASTCWSTIGGHAGGGPKIGDVDFGAAAAEFDENESR